MIETDNTIHITKSKMQVSSIVEIKEICSIQVILEKYQEHSSITISLDEVIIKL